MKKREGGVWRMLWSGTRYSDPLPTSNPGWSAVFTLLRRHEIKTVPNGSFDKLSDKSASG